MKENSKTALKKLEKTKLDDYIFIKEEFIKYFGEEKWDEEEKLTKLQHFSLAVAQYLNIEALPIIVEDIPEDSRFYPAERYIGISPKSLDSPLEACKCIAHELRHLYQQEVVSKNQINHPLYDLFKEDLEKGYQRADPTDEQQFLSYAYSVLEIDAFAFTKYILKVLLDVEVIYPEPVYEEILIMYIKQKY